MAERVSAVSVLHVICPQPVTGVGGADLHLLDLVEEQVRTETQVTVLALGNDTFRHQVAARGAQLARVPALWQPSFFPAFVGQLHNDEVDVVHGHGYSADIVALLAVGAARRLARASAGIGPAVVLTVHGFVRSTGCVRVRTAIDERCLRFADAVIATSRVETSRLTQMLPRGVIHYVPNGIRAPSAAVLTKRAKPPRHIAFVGRLAPEKRPDLFLRVAAELAADHPDMRFTVIGAGPLTKPLRSLTHRLGISDRCHFTGLVDDVERRLGTIDIFLSLSDSEGTPRAVLEAMAQGVTVVATAVGGVPDLINDGITGVLVPPGPPAVLAATTAIRSLLVDAHRLREIGRAASEVHKSGFLVQDMAERIGAVYDSVLLDRFGNASCDL